MTKHFGVKTSLEKQENHMSKRSKDNVVKFPKKENRSEIDKQFVELEHQANLIEEQRKRIAKLLEKTDG